MTVVISILIFLLILSVLVFVHEFGHFIVAKLSGIKVEEFGIGFPPKLLSVKRGKTVYSLNAIPFGGFVRLYGEDDNVALQKKNPPDAERMFISKPRLTRGLVVIAGIGMNFLFGIILFTLLYALVGVPSRVQGKLTILLVEPGSAADQSGLKQYDRVSSIDNQTIASEDQFRTIVKQSVGKSLLFHIERSDLISLSDGLIEKGVPLELNINVVPKEKTDTHDGFIGIVPGYLPITQTSQVAWYMIPVKASASGLREARTWTIRTIDGVRTIFSQLATQQKIPQGVSGPVGIYQISSFICSQGFASCADFVGVLSINLAVLNILPLSPLDGGKLFFIAIEALFRGRAKAIRVKVERAALVIGTILVLLFLLAVTQQDILRLLGQ